jgi:acetoin utilization deacetylase AcuC-like enzyme
MSARAVGYCHDERYFWHDSGLESYDPWVQPKPSADGEATKRRLHNLVVVSGLIDELVHVSPRAATDADLLRFHTREYVERVKAVSAQPAGGVIGHELHISRGGAEIASLAVGGVLACVDAVLDGAVASAYALVRPPGHHAEADHGHGYCVYSNVSLAAAYALEARGLARVAIVDFDVHHGNGSAAHFAARADALVVSLHQDGLYPLGTGGVGNVGEGAGRGYTLNVPLPPGSGWGAYADALARVVLPALRAYRPQLLLVSAGYDASFLDPLGRMSLTSHNYRDLAGALVAAADDLCGGRLVVAHEGGYSETYVPFCGVAVLEAMRGVRSPVCDPFADDVGSAGWQALQPHQRAAVDAAAANLAVALLPPPASTGTGSAPTATPPRPPMPHKHSCGGGASTHRFPCTASPPCIRILKTPHNTAVHGDSTKGHTAKSEGCPYCGVTDSS